MRAQQGFQASRLEAVWFQPPLVVLRAEDHWHPVVDGATIVLGYAAENLATLHRLALNLLKREKTKKRGIRGKMLNASWDQAYLLRLLGVEPKEI